MTDRYDTEFSEYQTTKKDKMNRYKFDDAEHLHSLDGRPLMGTSTACKIIAKPLTWWASGMAVGALGWKNGKLMVDGKYKTTPKEERLALAAPHLEKIKGMTTAEYVALLDEAYKAHNVKLTTAAGEGTDLHALLESYCVSCIKENKGIPLAHSTGETPQVSAFVDWSLANVSSFLFSEAHCFSETLWLGGISDAGAVLKNGNRALIDFKSAKAAYFDHFIQLALYDIQISETGMYDKDGNWLVDPMEFNQYIVFPFGATPLKPFERTDVSAFKEAARAAVTLYKHSLQFEG